MARVGEDGQVHQLLQLLGGRGLGISLLPLKWLSEQFLR